MTKILPDQFFMITIVKRRNFIIYLCPFEIVLLFNKKLSRPSPPLFLKQSLSNLMRSSFYGDRDLGESHHGPFILLFSSINLPKLTPSRFMPYITFTDIHPNPNSLSSIFSMSPVAVQQGEGTRL
jgi:hypothetical protein